MEVPNWKRIEPGLVALLALAAALRVLVYAAAFPLFNNIDEYAHFDLVSKYARGHDPLRDPSRYDADSIRLRVAHASPEYLRAPRPGARPLHHEGPEAVERALARHGSAFAGPNHEIHTPPAYYVVAAGWYRLERAIGLDLPRAAYGVRFMNALFLALVVWGTHVYARTLHPDRPELTLGAPLLAAFLPQDVFYGINNDPFSPVVGLGALLAGLAWLRREGPAPALALATGALAAVAVLTKLTNLPVLAVALGFALLRLRRERSARTLLPFAIGLLPLGLWVLRNQLVLGDLTGNGAKLALYGWSVRTPGRVLEHPLFSLEGAWGYLMHMLMVYWRGETIWHGEALRVPGADAFYCLSSVLFLGIGTVAGAWGRERSATGLHTALVLLGVGTLAALSVAFEYAETGAPSREYPFFAGGRLILCTLPAFVCLYVAGLSTVFRPLSRWRPWLGPSVALVALLALGVAITVSEARLHAPVFASAYNAYALH